MNTKRWYGVKDLEKKYGRMTLGMFIRTFREADKISQANFARKMGLSRANLCDIEKGRKLVGLTRAADIAKDLGVPEKVLIQLAMQDTLRVSNLGYQIELKAS